MGCNCQASYSVSGDAVERWMTIYENGRLASESLVRIPLAA
ncbi:MAG TPA: hypothetical protein VM889_05140 [Candidatus Thermoplasmatota archaeon]|nr:hypothetical protein [Candidatus Thermoplasmatota archaeon]